MAITRCRFSLFVIHLGIICVGTINVNLDLVYQKYDPVGFGCIASCCTALPGAGPCGTVETLFDSTTSNSVEEAYYANFEKVSVAGAFYSYLVYARFAPPGNAAQLKHSRAQWTFWSQASARNFVAKYNLFATPAQLADNQFTPTYWVITCIQVNPVTGNPQTTKNLTNVSSAFSTTVPLPSTYCT